MFRDEAPWEESRRIVLDAPPDEAPLLDVSPDAVADAPPIAPAAPPGPPAAPASGPAEGARTTAPADAPLERRSSILPQRRVARPPREDLPSLTGYAACPACAAKNPPDARTCGRCGADIPPPGPPPGLRAPQAIGGVRAFAPAERIQPHEVATDMLPPAIQERLIAQAREADARAASVALREAAYLENVTRLTAGAYGLGGLFLSAILLSGLPVTISFLADGALGWGAGRQLVKLKGGRMPGLALYGGAAFASAALKLALGGMDFLFSDQSAALAFLPLSGLVLAGLIGGSLAGLWIEQRFADAGT